MTLSELIRLSQIFGILFIATGIILVIYLKGKPSGHTKIGLWFLKLESEHVYIILIVIGLVLFLAVPLYCNFQSSSISVSSSPANASIYLGGSYVGNTPMTLDYLKKGSYNITLKLSGYEDWSQTRNVDAGKLDSISPTLTPRPEINITYPSDNQLVNAKEIVNGTAKNIPDDDKIWILVYSYNNPKSDSRYYPLDSWIVQQNGEYSLLDTEYIGSSNDNGSHFDILAVLANKQANEAFAGYIETSNKTGEWEGMEKIPSGAKVYDKNTVKRI